MSVPFPFTIAATHLIGGRLSEANDYQVTAGNRLLLQNELDVDAPVFGPGPWVKNEPYYTTPGYERATDSLLEAPRIYTGVRLRFKFSGSHSGTGPTFSKTWSYDQTFDLLRVRLSARAGAAVDVVGYGQFRAAVFSDAGGLPPANKCILTLSPFADIEYEQDEGWSGIASWFDPRHTRFNVEAAFSQPGTVIGSATVSGVTGDEVVDLTFTRLRWYRSFAASYPEDSVDPPTDEGGWLDGQSRYVRGLPMDLAALTLVPAPGAGLTEVGADATIDPWARDVRGSPIIHWENPGPGTLKAEMWLELV